MTLHRFTNQHEACPEGQELIHVDCVSHTYPDGSVGIHQMCFRVHPGEIVGLCGANGSGKSTLIEHLNGLLEPSEGRIAVLGADMKGRRKDIWKNVGIVFQRSDDQLFAPTVLDDVMFGPINMGLSIADAKKAAEEALETVGAAHLAQKMPNYLSGGQKRLVCIAGVLAMKPKVIAMDEPTSDLDPQHAEIVEQIIRDLRNRHGISVVIATHDMDMAARLCDRICVVKGGSIIADGTPADVFYDGQILAESGLKKPRVAETYEAICRVTGTSPCNRPITPEDLALCVEEMLKERLKTNLGDTQNSSKDFASGGI
ncbi:energy-coupling factor ABC transporter ATP-binding protein [Methanocella arvoryzae]|uniref:ABC-type cobalt transport system, ATPase component n=1 Tax=Methanocella arvoryzae (strain DSM 22066 / NBRC 105507 / MRE50) TaxID=351160 RepID=Q0W7Y7_METAR|nr:ATP-binding cassette domain-containing protein [Methanocella arvoryzae]CAJ35506.1 putative ABC-type cobalt transport system, ATPase component [Methanocella arvoryzae MRE50]